MVPDYHNNDPSSLMQVFPAAHELHRQLDLMGRCTSAPSGPNLQTNVSISVENLSLNGRA